MLEICRELVHILERGERGVLATVVGSTGSIPGKAAARMLVRPDGTSLGTIGGGRLEAEVLAMAPRVLGDDRPILQGFQLTAREAEEIGICGGVVQIFLEPIGSPVVHIFGAGHVGKTVAGLCLFAGFNVAVVDDREEFACRERFPEPIRLLVSDFTSAFGMLTIGPDACIVIVTRDHVHDEQVLAGALRTPASYIGLIGSKTKVQASFKALEAAGADPDRLRSVRAPIGLDIGARTCEEIAVSIAAELIAHRRRAFIKADGPERNRERTQPGA